MIVIDSALEHRQLEGNPIRVGLIGAGYMGRGIALQIEKFTAGMQLVAVANRTLSEAKRAYEQAGVQDIQTVSKPRQLQESIRRAGRAITKYPGLLCQAAEIDVIVEATGTIEYAARIVLQAIEAGKHVVLMNAELDATLGPILKVRADRAGVVFTNSDGDQPGVIMNLLRYVAAIGCRPVLAGNMKGLQDPYRTPETQREYARQYRQKPTMVTSFADGTKISMEMAVVANATGFRVGRRGMFGPACDHVRDALGLFPTEDMLTTGLVDYILCSDPPGGVFVIGYNPNPIQQQYLRYYKMGDGPFYIFYTPYHICHFETPLSIARAVLFRDAVVAPIGPPVCDVIAVAKRDLKAGERIDGIGGFTCYGMIDNAQDTLTAQLLPMGLAEGCELKREIKKDHAISYGDVIPPRDRLCDRLREEQSLYFKPAGQRA